MTDANPQNLVPGVKDIGSIAEFRQLALMERRERITIWILCAGLIVTTWTAYTNHQQLEDARASARGSAAEAKHLSQVAENLSKSMAQLVEQNKLQREIFTKQTEEQRRQADAATGSKNAAQSQADSLRSLVKRSGDIAAATRETAASSEQIAASAQKTIDNQRRAAELASGATLVLTSVVFYDVFHDRPRKTKASDLAARFDILNSSHNTATDVHVIRFVITVGNAKKWISFRSAPLTYAPGQSRRLNVGFARSMAYIYKRYPKLRDTLDVNILVTLKFDDAVKKANTAQGCYTLHMSVRQLIKPHKSDWQKPAKPCSFESDH